MPAENNKSGNTLFVRISGDNMDAVRGKWVVVKFNAGVKPSYRNIEKIQESTSGWINSTANKQGSPLTYFADNEKDYVALQLMEKYGNDNIVKIMAAQFVFRSLQCVLTFWRKHEICKERHIWTTIGRRLIDVVHSHQREHQQEQRFDKQCYSS